MIMAGGKTTSHRDMDWNLMWQKERARQSWQGRSSADWDRHAADFVKRHADSPFVRTLLAMLEIDPSWSILDVGAGPGTLTIPLAQKAAQVTAVDFSTSMLDMLEKRRKTTGLSNIQTVCTAWEDDWQQAGITTYDLVIACRSLAVHDLRAALQKIIRHARQKAVLVTRVGPTPFDPELFAAVNRPFHPGPDYIYPLNLLHQWGIYAQVQLLKLPATTVYTNPVSARDACGWILGAMDDQEQKGLDNYLQKRLHQNADGSYTLQHSQQPCWAVISWTQP